jgi:hypothetical protein
MKILFLLPVVLLLSACFHTTIVREPVTVEVPIPYCPAPPPVPTHDFLVDKLQPEDLADPGKVGQAYKVDMTFLREVHRIHVLILEQYKNTSQSFEETQKKIRELADKMKAASTTVE